MDKNLKQKNPALIFFKLPYLMFSVIFFITKNIFFYFYPRTLFDMPSLLFVYGSLRTGQSNHGYLAGCRFLGDAKTVSTYQVQDFGAFIGMLPGSKEVEGEVWEVSAHVLAKLDHFEAVDAGVFQRSIVYLQSPFVDDFVQAYFYSHEAGSLC